MTNFEKVLNLKLKKSIYNNYGKDNYDDYRFGKQVKYKSNYNIVFKNYIKKLISYKTGELNSTIIKNYELKLSNLYEKLNPQGKNLLVDIMAYRTLGYKKVKLPVNNKSYWNAIKKVKKLGDKNDTLNPNFMHFILEKFNLNKIGYNIEMYFSEIAIVIDFVLEQYSYKENGLEIVSVVENDVVLDIGGCWGDTALYFANKAGEFGKVYSFEFIPNNIKIWEINTNLNPILKKRIELVNNPVLNISNQEIFYLDNGPGSLISENKFEGYTGTTKTISIDDFVNNNNINKVDFIKMDIEGAEPLALEGAINTIKKFKPKLAIAIYHSMEDFVNIPEWILNLNCGYELFLGHYTIHSEETVIFAKVK